MILDGMILAFIIGYFKGGSLKGFEDLNFKGGVLILIAFALQLAMFLISLKIPVLRETAPYWVMIFYALFIILAYQNRQIPGVRIIILGILLNVIVMAANGGKMPVDLTAATLVDPVYAEMLKTDAVKHSILSEETRLWFLGDIIPLLPPYPNNKVISIGDVILNVGGFIFVWKLMMAKKRVGRRVAEGGEIE